MATTHASAETGFEPDIATNITIAALQEGMVPPINVPFNYSTVDVVCDIIVNLALNKKRKHNMYLSFFFVFFLVTTLKLLDTILPTKKHTIGQLYGDG